MPTRVLVTNADGHLGYGLVENLRTHGYEVSAGVCGSADERKVAPLRILGAKIIELDVARPDKLAPAMQGSRCVFHTTANRVPATRTSETTSSGATTAAESVINVLAAARNAGVKRIVFTSSPKTKGAVEERARDFIRANEMSMVSIEPSVILGPGFRSHSPGTETLEHILREEWPALPRLNAAYVDVRDAAELHRLAFENENAAGSYPATGAYAKIEDVVRLIREIDPTIRVPCRSLPTWALRPAALLDALAYRILGSRRFLSDDLLDELEHEQRSEASSEKAKLELGWIPRPFSETLADTLTWIRQTFMSS